MDEKAIEKLSESLDSFTKEWSDKLPVVKANALRLYKGLASNAINKVYLGREKSALAVKLAKLLDETLASAPPLDRDLVVFRGISGVEPITKVKKGKISRYETFLSSSISRTKAEWFRDQHADGVLIEIRVPKGVSWRGKYSLHP